MAAISKQITPSTTQRFPREFAAPMLFSGETTSVAIEGRGGVVLMKRTPRAAIHGSRSRRVAHHPR